MHGAIKRQKTQQFSVMHLKEFTQTTVIICIYNKKFTSVVYSENGFKVEKSRKPTLDDF